MMNLVRSSIAQLASALATLIPRLVAVLAILVAAWALASLARRVVRAGLGRATRDQGIHILVAHITYYLILALGLVAAMSAGGINPQSVATGLGLTGVALGFALKDILSNFTCGLLILAFRPFHVGDQIIVGPTEGTPTGVEAFTWHRWTDPATSRRAPTALRRSSSGRRHAPPPRSSAVGAGWPPPLTKLAALRFVPARVPDRFAASVGRPPPRLARVLRRRARGWTFGARVPAARS